MSVSNATHVTLRNVDFNLNGNISCEVTTESPSFYTATATSVLQVVGESHRVKWKITLCWKWHYVVKKNDIKGMFFFLLKTFRGVLIFLEKGKTKKGKIENVFLRFRVLPFSFDVVSWSWEKGIVFPGKFRLGHSVRS